MHFALLIAKALIASKLTKRENICRLDLRSIIISASTRYSSFYIKIPNLDGTSWVYAHQMIWYRISDSLRYYSTLKRIVPRYEPCI
uniref:Uncharacterized protein n=1 Tax=Lepeophtheirus salmonis TaxID=72036 RepID=A0A0K2V771_LEPSM